MLVFGIHRFQRIERDRKVQISRIEINHVIDSVGGDIFQDFFHRIAVRIDKRHAVSVLDILNDHILDQSGFTHAGFSNDVHVPAPVVLADAKRRFAVAKIGFGEQDDIVILVHNFNQSVNQPAELI